MAAQMQNPNLVDTIERKIIQTKQGPVEYVDVGEGPVVVTLHGAMGGYEQSLILAQTLGRQGYRYIAISRPGYLNTPIQSGMSPIAQADLIAAFLTELDIEAAGVMAVSGGGPCAIHFGLRYEDRCMGLILISTCADIIETPIPASFKIMTFLARSSWFVRRIQKKAKKNLEKIAKRSITDPDILERTIGDPEVWPLFSKMLLCTFDKMDQRLEGTKNDIEISHTNTYPLEDLNLPVLVIHGKKDPHIDYEKHALQFKKRLFYAELLTIEDGEHVAMFTHREVVKEKVDVFMQQYF